MTNNKIKNNSISEPLQVIRWPNGSNTYYKQNSKSLHRLYGPACEWNDGTYEWWVNGINVGKNHPFLNLLIEYNLYDKWCLGDLSDSDWVLLKMSMGND